MLASVFDLVFPTGLVFDRCAHVIAAQLAILLLDATDQLGHR